MPRSPRRPPNLPRRAEPIRPAPALTGLAGALAHFLEDDFTETDTGITEVAATGDPRAIAIIEALQDGRLSYSAEQKKVFYKDASGKLIDAATGAPAEGAEPADLADVRLNNRVRRALDAAIGGLSLQARRSRQALRVGAGRVQVARAERAARARCGAWKRKPTRGSSGR